MSDLTKDINEQKANNISSEKCDDTCDVFVYDNEKVERLSKELHRTKGLSALFKVLADDTRVKVIYSLTQEDELCVCDIAKIINASNAVASHHLRLLHNMGLVKFRKEGKMAFYSLLSLHIRYLMKEALQIMEKEDDNHEFW